MGYENLSNNADELALMAKMLARRANEKEREMNVLLEQLDKVNAKLHALNGGAPTAPTC